MAGIAVSHLTFAFGDKPVLDNVSLEIRAGARLAILGGNGSGKTTLAHFLAGWLPDGRPHQGTVTCDGRPWTEWSLAERACAVQLVGQVPVRHLSGRAFTVREEVAFGPENLNLPISEIQARTERALAQCRLEQLAERDPFTLSGGEQQRLVIAAALALEPRFLVLDEPLTNLDPEAREHVLALLLSLPRDRAVVLLETSPDAALAFAEDFMLLDGGRITAHGSARDVLLHGCAVRTLGLPSIPRACRELGLFGELADSELPLSLDEAKELIKGAADARR